MGEKQKVIAEKGAVLQRDKNTYAIIPHFPGGICTPDNLRRIADVAEKYKAQAIKITSAQRIALVGLKEEELDNIWKDLGLNPGAAVGNNVRSIKFCPGTSFCILGQQDAVKIGMELDKLYHGVALPSKLKIGVSGCPNSCAESWIKDIGLIGTKNGWRIVVGGSAAAKPRIAEKLVDNLTEEEALDLVKRIIDVYKQEGKGRLGTWIEKIGMDEFKKKIGI